jgi:hypothetical protein
MKSGPKKITTSIVVTLFALSGCATTPSQKISFSDVGKKPVPKMYSEAENINVNLNSADKRDYREMTCANSAWGSKGAEIKYQTEEEKSSDDFTFYTNNFVRHLEGIRHASVLHDKLQIVFYGRGQVAEFTAPIYRTVNKTIYEARPGSTLFATVLLLGLPLLFTPTDTAKRAFGCTDERVVKKYVNVSQKRETGNVSWLDTHKKQTLIIDGVGQSFSIDVTPPESGQILINLRPRVEQGVVDNIAKIQISCPTCVIDTGKDSSQEESIASMAKKVYVFEHDFRPVKNEIQEKILQERMIEEKRIRDERILENKQRQEELRLKNEADEMRRRAEQAEALRRQQRQKQEQLFKM